MGYDYTLKVLLLGDSSSGKKEFVNRYISGFFQDDLSLTLGVDFYSKATKFNGKTIKLQIWYFREEQRFRFLLPQYCKNTHGAIIIYDITNLKSLESLPDWTQILREHLGDIPILLVGNKLDLEKSRVVPKEEGVLTAKKYNLSACVEVSSKTGKNIDKVFEDLIRLILANEEYQTPIKMKKYEEFIVYDIRNTGYPTKLNINPEELQYHLNPKKVLIIIRNDLRRIFIWKGAKSPVRKRFISARVAQDLQRNLIQNSRYHRCKIISIDQGDELQEFLNAFRLESMRVTEKPRITDEDIMILDLESEEGIQLIKLFEEAIGVHATERGKETKLFIKWLKGEEVFVRKRFPRARGNMRGRDDDRYPYPYVFKPPEPPDDIVVAPGMQLHTSPKKKVLEEKIHCQYCGIKLAKDEQLTHSCKKKPKNT